MVSVDGGIIIFGSSVEDSFALNDIGDSDLQQYFQISIIVGYEVPPMFEKRKFLASHIHLNTA